MIITHLSNDDTFEGGIIVGADGVYSTVRQYMYKQLETEERLPKSDHGGTSFWLHLFGELDQGAWSRGGFLIINDRHCSFRVVLGDYMPSSVRFWRNENGVVRVIQRRK
jgi:2-polyprenyl-6-methoxyphenol hydroxylase-like FAD-dependent oxidoreductase